MKKAFLLVLCFCIFTVGLFAQEADYILQKDIPYYSELVNKSDAYISERCKLDVYYPNDNTNVATIVWFQGGGITAGNKHIPKELLKQKVIVINVNYR